MKGWTRWGKGIVLPEDRACREYRSFWGLGEFRLHLRASIRYVMADSEVSAIFDPSAGRKLLIFTTRLRRRDNRPIRPTDVFRLFVRASTRKLPRPLKYLPPLYVEEPVVFAWPLPPDLVCPAVWSLTSSNFHRVLEATCLVPLAMGQPLPWASLSPDVLPAGNAATVFIDGGYTMKMPMALFEENTALRSLARWAATDRTIVFSCDPRGNLWETSFRLRDLRGLPSVSRAVEDGRLLVVHPDHPIEAGFLCHDNDTVMRTFHRGREQGERLLRSEAVRRFLEGSG